jgi:heavy metal efflux system protein
MKIKSLILLLFFSIAGLMTYGQTEPLSLEKARQTALKNHPVIQQGQMYITQQQTLVKTSTLFDPLNISSSFGQINSSATDYYVGISQSFKMPGVYKSENKLLQQNVNIANASAAVTKNELIRNVTIAYYHWLYAWQQFRLLNELDSTYQDFARYADKKFEVGETGILEKTNAKTQLITVRLKKKQSEADIHIYESELHQWMVNGDRFVPPFDFGPLPAPLISDSVGLQANPLVLYNQQQIAYNNAAVQLEKARGLPSVSVGGATQSIDKVSSYYIFNAGINIPIFKNGVKARTRAAMLNVQISEKELEKNRLQLSSTYDQLFEQYRKASDQLQYYKEEGLQYASVILNAANKSYKAGDIGYVEYIQNINEAINIKAGYLQTINDYNQTVIQINYLLNR